MADVVDIKKTLKQWETQFRKEHGRKPNKADIDAAPASIKETYLKYTKLKKNETSSEKILLKDNSETERNASRLLTAISSTENSEQKVSDERREGTEEKLSDGKGREANSDNSLEVSLNTCDNNKDRNDQAEVWGSQFDRKIVREAEKTSGTKSTVSSSKPSYLKHLGQKMFQQSMKLNKDQLQKSKPKASLWKKPDTPRPKNPFIQENDPSNQNALKESVASTLADVDEIDGSVNPVIDKPANFGKVFEKALSISKHKGETKGLDRDSDVYLNKFQTKVKPKQSFLPSSLSSLIDKYRLELDIAAETCETGEIEKDNYKDSADDDDDCKTGGHSWNVPVSKLIKDDENDSRRKAKRGGKKDTRNEPVEETKEKTKRKKNFGNVEDSVGNLNGKKGDSDGNSVDSMPEKGKRNKNHADFGKGSDGRESKKSELSNDAESKNKHCSNKSNVSEEEKMDTFEFNDDLEVESPKKLKPARRKVKAAQKSKTLNESKTYQKGSEESDENLRDIATKQTDDSDDMDDTNVRKRKKTAKKEPTAKKRKTTVGDVAVGDADGNAGTSTVIRKPARSKPVSNDNFIRLNMKIKTYKRKGRQMTGSQYKRKMWKEKMQARSKSYGDACFKCGQSGHWANKCPGGQSKSHYDKEPVLDEDFPSMQEAAMLARGCQVQKPVKSTDVSQDQGESEKNVPPDVTSEEDDVDLEIQSGIVRTRPEAFATPLAMKPLFDCEEGENIPETPDLVLKGLRKFGFDHFRPGQKEAVMRILCGLSTLVVLSTGGGKSLCYQLPAYLYAQRSSCITLVISPLVSLMEDQVTGLPNGVRGVCLHTNMTAHQRENVLEAVKSGKAQFLLVSPEAIAGGSMSLISSMSSLPPVAFACIDEAHCLSEWSHNFRPSYLRLCKVLQEKLGVQCFLGLTATATLSTASDVARHLKIDDFRKATVRGSPIPANLILSVSRDEDREQALIGLLKGERFGTLDSIIVYCTRRDQTDKVATIIRTCMNTGTPAEMVTKGRGKRPKLEWDAESYHAGLTAAQRKRVQNAFMAGRLRIVVATVAFGMGLDKSDVRGIIHFNMPKSFESYVQEIGRAGRDGKQADCHVFLDPEGKDLCELRRHTYANTVDYRTLKKLVQKVFLQCRCKDVHERHAQAKLEAALFDDAFDMEMCDNTDLVSELKQNSRAGDGMTSDAGETPSDQTTTTANQTTAAADQASNPDQTTTQKTVRLCPGHERALPIQTTVLDLDVKEEGISTLLCYLELHSSQWLENMSNVYATCKVQCYGGPSQLQAVARKCPPVAVAIASARKDGKNFSNVNNVEFNVVDISDTMGWDSGPVKKELKLLQWNFDSGGPKKTGVMVEFSDLAYHFRTHGDFSTEELDDILQFLHERVQRQEKSEIRNLSHLYQALKSVSHRNYWMCSEEADLERNDKLKVILNQYFDQQSVAKDDDDDDVNVQDEPIPEFSKGQLISDIRSFYNLYGQEHSLNGRAIARIFHGIASPCFPATTWGRVRRFWRSHLNIDFNTLMKIATKELISFR